MSRSRRTSAANTLDFVKGNDCGNVFKTGLKKTLKSNSNKKTQLVENPVEVGDRFKIQRGDKWFPSTILDKRLLKYYRKQEKRGGDVLSPMKGTVLSPTTYKKGPQYHEYYVHYDYHDNRYDEWVDLDRIDSRIALPPNHDPNSNGIIKNKRIRLGKPPSPILFYCYQYHASDDNILIEPPFSALSRIQLPLPLLPSLYPLYPLSTHR